MWSAQFIKIRIILIQYLTSGGAGTMGFGLPAAIGAQVANPDKKSTCYRWRWWFPNDFPRINDD